MEQTQTTQSFCQNCWRAYSAGTQMLTDAWKPNTHFWARSFNLSRYTLSASSAETLTWWELKKEGKKRSCILIRIISTSTAGGCVIRIRWLGILTSSPWWLASRRCCATASRIDGIFIVIWHWFVIHSHMCVVLTFLALIAFIAGQAEAEERVDLVNAGASVLARLRLAVVYICQEERRHEALRRVLI